MMRTSVAAATLVLLAIALFAGARRDDATCAVDLVLLDGQTERPIAGIVSITRAKGDTLDIPELLPRGLGLGKDLPIAKWYVLPGRRTITLPREKLTLRAISGLETEEARVALDLTGKDQSRVSVSLHRFFDMASQAGQYSANTHLHLQKITREESDRYLKEVPRGDDLDALFVSYLERAVADKQYTSNEYSKKELVALERDSPVKYGNGEEHRHNFTGFGEGYGHVMLLDIKKLIQPVSIGPGIMKLGTDGIPLARGIAAAQNDDATVIWCHNAWGLEAVPNFLAGRVDAQNIFDGGVHGSYKDSFYRYLNAGLKVPFSTGTDWFMYDFSRVYVDLDGDVTVDAWLKALREGRSFITNGPLLHLRAGRTKVGGTVDLAKPGKLTVRCRGRGRIDFGRIELVKNGQVIHSAPTSQVGGHFEASNSFTIDVDAPCWLALRTPPPPVEGDARLQAAVPKNELGRDIFAHTSPIYVTVGGRSHFDVQVAAELLAEMRRAQQTIRENGTFADEQERQRVLDVYRDGIKLMQRRLAAAR